MCISPTFSTVSLCLLVVELGCALAIRLDEGTEVPASIDHTTQEPSYCIACTVVYTRTTTRLYGRCARHRPCRLFDRDSGMHNPRPRPARTRLHSQHQASFTTHPHPHDNKYHGSFVSTPTPTSPHRPWSIIRAVGSALKKLARYSCEEAVKKL